MRAWTASRVPPGRKPLTADVKAKVLAKSKRSLGPTFRERYGSVILPRYGARSF